MNHQLQIKVGGNTFDLAFNMAAYRAIKKTVGEDPLTLAMNLTDIEAVEKYATAFFHAGLLGAYAEKMQQPDFTDDQVKGWVDSLNVSHLTRMITAYRNSMQVEADGEVSKDTQQ